MNFWGIYLYNIILAHEKMRDKTLYLSCISPTINPNTKIPGKNQSHFWLPPGILILLYSIFMKHA